MNAIDKAPAGTLPLILYVDDEEGARKYFQRALQSQATVLTAASVDEGKTLLTQHGDAISVLVSDQRMPGAYGNALLFHAWERHPQIVRVLTTAYSELAQTIEAVNQGRIHRYLPKPWDITTLRLEMKQAADLASLRRRHDRLLGEKLASRRREVLANRIGLLYGLCLADGPQGAALDAYLSGALCARVAAAPAWLLDDYAQLASADACRAAGLARAVRGHVAALDARGAAPAQALALLAEVFGSTCHLNRDGAVVLSEPAVLAEYLDGSPDAAVSSRHAAWLALLLFLARRGTGVLLTSSAAGVQCRLAGAGDPPTRAALASWIARF
ncbi:response regulator [Massilia sp. YMA4]|uniref:response regulator n=1 Tax=Massilia sp. YMA4 TaxID=1593482 RepID=UPI000DD161C0|nr:response regulator [Massilia sp. YMA4]AXA90759.1 response regulator [Massilia sp. YMA4]